ncbi:AMP-binding protein [Agarilytica rhodophyticola]|uniref:AMP-binding protein n=1 Tax=Agarilytica rhodophyticola TaxID=1737490 RepID=UPI000B342DEE|nr:AMP-binding protein [Agarilytica rhodophyticola]
MKDTAQCLRLSTIQQINLAGFNHWQGESLNLPTIALCIRIDGVLDNQALHKAITDVVATQDALRSHYRKLPGIDGLVQEVLTMDETLIAWQIHEAEALLELSSQFASQAHLAQANIAQALVSKVMADSAVENENSSQDERQTTLSCDLFPGENQACHYLVVAMPALSADRGSLTRFTRALAAAYQSDYYVDEDEFIGYPQFSEWLYDMAEDETAEQAHSFWQKHTAAAKEQGLPEFLLKRSHTNHAYCYSNPEDYAPLCESLSPELRQQLVTLAQEKVHMDEDACQDDSDPLESLLLLAWASLLSRHTQTNTVHISWLHDCREDYEELTSSFGLFLRPLPVTLNFPPEASLANTLPRITEHMASMREWQEMAPSDPELLKIFSHFAYEFSAGEGAVKNETFATSSVPATLNFASAALALAQEPFALRLHCQLDMCGEESRKENDLSLQLDYDSTRIDRGAAALLLQQFLCLLKNIASQSSQNLTKYSIIGEQERAWRSALHRSDISNNTLVDSNSNVPKQITHIAQHYPDALALIDDHQRWRYYDLERDSNQLAHALIAKGVDYNSKVAICLERTGNYIVTLLAVLKAGACFIPLEPQQPIGRVRSIVEDAEAFLITATDSVAGVSSDEFFQTFNDGQNWKASRHLILSILVQEYTNPQKNENGASEDYKPSSQLFPKLPPQRIITSKSPAYIIYTSGTTGRPKGVVIEHGQLNHYIAGAVENLELNTLKFNTASLDPLKINKEAVGKDGDSSWRSSWHYGLSSTLVADLGNTMIFPALCTGGCLHILDQATCIQSELLNKRAQQMPLDCMKIVPSHLDALLGSEELDDSISFLPKKRLILGGESCPPKLLQKIRAASLKLSNKQLSNSTLRIFNHYGPTETTVGVLVKELPKEIDQDYDLNSPVSLEQVMPGSHIYVLDSTMQIAATGTVGEVYIGGAQLSSGYLHKPAISAAVMLPDPFANTPGVRMYRSGDLARVQANGDITLLGRRDHQLKIRGYRIESGEIEALLMRHKSVNKALVMVASQGENEQLIAYLTVASDYASHDNAGNEQQTFDRDALITYLKQHVPDYMVPQQFIVLDTMPITANGKVDRKALPAAPLIKTTFIAPRNNLEKLLVNIWQEQLRVDSLGVQHNFFDMGGHSLLAIKISARICRLLQMELAPGIVFEHPSVAQLAEAIIARESAPGKTEATARIRLKLQQMTPEQRAALAAQKKVSGNVSEGEKSESAIDSGKSENKAEVKAENEAV